MRPLPPAAQVHVLDGEAEGELAGRVGRGDDDVACRSGGPSRETRDQPQVVDDHRGGVVREVRALVEDDLDVPRVERMLIQASAGELVEVEGQRTDGEGQAGAVGSTHGLEGLEHRLVGDQGVARLVPGRLGVPLLPHRRREVLRRLGGGHCILQTAAHDDAGRPEVRQHVGDRPLAAVGRRLELGVVEAAAELVKPADGVAQGGQWAVHRRHPVYPPGPRDAGPGGI